MRGYNMISSITKDKIQSGYSHVLKTTQLEQVLANNGIITDVTLIYTKPQVLGSIFEVYFWLPNRNVDYHRLYVRAGALINKDIQSAREGLINQVLPEFVKWIKGIEQLDKSSTLYGKRYFNGYYQNNEVLIQKD
jgi:hypothetical protein